MYRELGGYLSYMRTPVRELQEIRVSIIAEINAENKRLQEQKEEQQKREEEMKRLMQAGGRR